MRGSDSKVFRNRVEMLRRAMEGSNVHFVLLSPGPNMQYFTGFVEEASERTLVAVVPLDGEPFFLAPKMYGGQLRRSTWVKQIALWNDGENSLERLRVLLGENGAVRGRLAVDPRARAGLVMSITRLATAAEVIDAADLIRPIRMVKGKDEIRAVRKAFRVAEKVMGEAISSCGPGVRETEVRAVIRNCLAGEGCEESFPPIVSSGPDSAMPHNRGGERAMKPGDSVILDLGCLLNGYCSDMTRTIFIGRAPPKARKVYEVVRRAKALAYSRVSPGIPAQEVDRTARGLIRRSGYGEFFSHRTGHGVGVEVHEDPYIVEGNEEPLVAGNVFSIEPGIYLPGRLGVRIEDVVVLERDGAEWLSDYPVDLLVV